MVAHTDGMFDAASMGRSHSRLAPAVVLHLCHSRKTGQVTADDRK